MFRVPAYTSIMCRYICIGFIEYILAGRTLIDYTHLLLPHDFENNDNEGWM